MISSCPFFDNKFLEIHAVSDIFFPYIFSNFVIKGDGFDLKLFNLGLFVFSFIDLICLFLSAGDSVSGTYALGTFLSPIFILDIYIYMPRKKKEEIFEDEPIEENKVVEREEEEHEDNVEPVEETKSEPPKKEKKKRVLSEERKQQLREQLARGRLTSAKNRAKKAQVKKIKKKEKQEEIDNIIIEDAKKRKTNKDLQDEVERLKKELASRDTPKMETIEEERPPTPKPKAKAAPKPKAQPKEKPAPRPKQVVELPEGFAAPPPPPPPKKRSLLPRGLILNL